MKLTTIWTMPAMDLRERLRRTGVWALMTLAHRMPRRLAYWTFIDVYARHTIEHPQVIAGEVLAMDVLDAAAGGPK